MADSVIRPRKGQRPVLTPIEEPESTATVVGAAAVMAVLWNRAGIELASCSFGGRIRRTARNQRRRETVSKCYKGRQRELTSGQARDNHPPDGSP